MKINLLTLKSLSKKLILGLLFLPTISAAQPIINSNNLPKMYDRLVFNYCPYASSFNTIDSGANAFWDASDLKPYATDSSVNDYVKVPAGYSSLFPNATLCRKEVRQGYTSFDMFSLESNNYNNWGNISSSMPWSAIYSNAQLNLKFPFTMNTKASDTYTYKYKYMNDSGIVSGNVYIRGAGYGKLKLPGGISYDNALLIITNDYNVDDKGVKYKSYSFNWYVPERIGAVLSCFMDFDFNSGSWQSHMPSISFQKNPLKNTASVNNIERSNSILLFPNPANRVLYIKSAEATIREVSFLNSLGQTVLNESKLLSNSLTLDISSLSAGIYNVLIKDDKGNSFQKQLIK